MMLYSATNPISMKELSEINRDEERTIDLGPCTITVQRRQKDWMVYLNGNKHVWECDKSLDAAIGYMVTTYLHLLWNITHDESQRERSQRTLKRDPSLIAE